MTNDHPLHLMTDEEFLEIYNKHFPEHPYGTDRAQQILSYAGEVAIVSYVNGVTVGKNKRLRSTL